MKIYPGEIVPGKSIHSESYYGAFRINWENLSDVGKRDQINLSLRAVKPDSLFVKLHIQVCVSYGKELARISAFHLNRTICLATE